MSSEYKKGFTFKNNGVEYKIVGFALIDNSICVQSSSSNFPTWVKKDFIDNRDTDVKLPKYEKGFMFLHEKSNLVILDCTLIDDMWVYRVCPKSPTFKFSTWVKEQFINECVEKKSKETKEPNVKELKAKAEAEISKILTDLAKETKANDINIVEVQRNLASMWVNVDAKIEIIY